MVRNLADIDRTTPWFTLGVNNLQIRVEVFASLVGDEEIVEVHDDFDTDSYSEGNENSFVLQYTMSVHISFTR